MIVYAFLPACYSIVVQGWETAGSGGNNRESGPWMEFIAIAAAAGGEIWQSQLIFMVESLG